MAKRVEGNTESLMGLAEKVERATKHLNEQLGKREAELGHVQPLMRDAAAALLYCSKLPAFDMGGEHHQGFVATVGPTLKRLEEWLHPVVETEPASPG